MIKMYIDAATNGQPGSAGLGIVIVGQNIHDQIAIPLEKKMTIHEAEWEALIYGLKELIRRKYHQQIIFIYSDSSLVTKSLDNYKVRNPDFQNYLNMSADLMKEFETLIIEWIPRQKNRGADHLAKQALQKAKTLNENKRNS